MCVCVLERKRERILFIYICIYYSVGERWLIKIKIIFYDLPLFNEFIFIQIIGIESRSCLHDCDIKSHSNLFKLIKKQVSLLNLGVFKFVSKNWTIDRICTISSFKITQFLKYSWIVEYCTKLFMKSFEKC